MKRLFLLVFWIGVLSSCSNYESKVPLGIPGESKLDSSLHGKWILSEKNDNTSNGFVEIIPFNKHEYLIQLKEYADSSKYLESIINFRMYPTTINKKQYYNLQVLAPDEETRFMIYQIKNISGNRYKLYYLSKDLFKKEFDNTPDFRKYILAHQKEFDQFFVAEGILRRMVQK